jgi:hypothetical protein
MTFRRVSLQIKLSVVGAGLLAACHHEVTSPVVTAEYKLVSVVGHPLPTGAPEPNTGVIERDVFRLGADGSFARQAVFRSNAEGLASLTGTYSIRGDTLLFESAPGRMRFSFTLTSDRRAFGGCWPFTVLAICIPVEYSRIP